jgi:DNA-binding NarL/FixJ family response regulator
MPSGKDSPSCKEEDFTLEKQKPYRVVIAEDHKMLRDMLRFLFDTDPEAGVEVVAEAADGREAIQSVALHRPDLVLMDLSMPGMSGEQAILEIKKSAPSTKILVVTMHSDEDIIMNALKAGADGYVLKGDSLEELLLAMKHVMEGNPHLSPEVSQKVLQGYVEVTNHGEPGSSSQTLTPRERAIIKLVAEGCKSREIATMLSISPKTVETHRANTMRKLGLRNAAEMTVYAIESGLVEKPMLKSRRNN